jgi:DNA-binding CsgD family transcriptional regulator
MKFDSLFAELFGKPSDIETLTEGDTFLKDVQRFFEIKHVAYLGVNLPVKSHQNYYAHNSYSGEWAMRYQTQNYVSIDPIVKRGLTSLLPIDWGNVNDLSDKQREFLGEAREFGVGTQGLTFPVRGMSGETAIFCVNADMSDHAWRSFRKTYMKELRIISDFFHQRVLERTAPGNIALEEVLTNRETECLKWCAEGKTYWETSMIIGVSERTVRFFMENARHKLNCLTNTHAVVTAMSRGLI